MNLETLSLSVGLLVIFLTVVVTVLLRLFIDWFYSLVDNFIIRVVFLIGLWVTLMILIWKIL